MKISVICIGDELLKGSTINTNLGYIGQELLNFGIIPFNSMTVPDSQKPVCEAVEYLLPKSDIIITSGGLGPTADDMTKAVIAEYFGMKLIRNEDAVKNIEARWNRLGRGAPPESVMTQALIPDGAEMLPNNAGTAPGIWIKKDCFGAVRYLIMLPGPPVELRTMFTESVMPRIKALMSGRLYTDLFYLAGIPESIVEEKMIPVINEYSDLSVAYCASFWEVKLFLTSPFPETVRTAAEKVRKIFVQNILCDGNKNLVDEVSMILRKEKCMLATAESCTGGMIAAAITDLSGSSEIFAGSVVAYSNDIKEKILGVSPEIIKAHGAVSSECAAAMLDKICEKFGTDAGISVTGIAGPTGGTPEKPVGLVYIGVRFRDKKVVKEFNFMGTRELLRMRSQAAAFNIFRNLYYGYSV
jgi:nicotinamide-nucleotide amidase